MLTIEPIGGLCNRLRALDSSIALAKKIDKPLHLIWRRNRKFNELNCSFLSLFCMPDIINKLSQPYTPVLLKKILNKINIYRFKYQHCFFQKDIEKLKNNNFNFENFKNYRSVYISTLHSFFYNPHPFCDLLPKPSILNAVGVIQSNFDSFTIGVHIRRGDNLKSKSVSTIEKFENRMNLEVLKNPAINFFLATDDLSVEMFFKERFKDKIIVYSKREIKRSKPVAIEDALIDLLCLSKTNKILGSYWSSFTDTAAQINNTEISIIK